jgi:O-antigen/teichoic acid export membrane protein
MIYIVYCYGSNIKMSSLILRDGFKYLSSRLLLSIIGFFAIPLIVRVYGVEVYGSYALIISFITMIQVATFGSLNQGYIRFRNEVKNRLFLFSVSFKWLIYLQLLLIPVLTLSYFFLGDMVIFSLVNYFALLTFCLFAAVRVTYQSERKIYTNAAMEFIRLIVIIGIPVAYAYFFGSGDINTLIICFSLGNIVFFLSILRWKDFNIDGSTNIKINRLLRYGFPVCIWATLAAFMAFMDRYLISASSGELVLGGYATLTDVAIKLGAVIIMPVASAIMPVFLVDQDVKHLVGSNKYFLIILLVCLFISGSLSASIEIWSSILFDTKITLYSSRIDYFLLFTGLLVWQSGILAHKFLEINKKTNMLALNILISLIFHYLLVLIFLNDFGVAIFAYATFISGLLYFLLSYIGAKIND